MYFLIAFVILLVSHLTVDRDIPSDMKITVWVIFGVICILYVILGLIL